MDWTRTAALALIAVYQFLVAIPGSTQQLEPNRSAAAAEKIAEFFSAVGDQIFEECIFELSAEQIEVQQALIKAYILLGASDQAARQLTVRQIQPPKLSEKCELIRQAPSAALPAWNAKLTVRMKPKEGELKLPARPDVSASPLSLADRKVLPQWDCEAGVDYVTIHHNGYERKLTAGEICNPFEDVVHEVPDTVRSFRLGSPPPGRLGVPEVHEDPRGVRVRDAQSSIEVRGFLVPTFALEGNSAAQSIGDREGGRGDAQ